MSNRYNIFKDFYETKDEILRNEFGVYTELNVKLISEVEKYLKSGIWSKNDTEFSIWQRWSAKTTSETLGRLLSINPNTLRSMLSRINNRLKDTLFGGRPLYAVCKTTDQDELKEQLSYIEYLNCNFNFYAEVSTSLISCINKTPFVESAEEFTETDIFNALAFLAMHSKSVIDYQINSLNLQALEHVISKLSDNNFNNEFSYFKRLQMNYKKAFSMREETISKIKNNT